MQHLRIVLILILYISFYGDSFAQTKVYSQQETKLNDKASRYLKNANFEKSLIFKVALFHDK
jgi:hypothetical protein